MKGSFGSQTSYEENNMGDYYAMNNNVVTSTR